MMRFLRLALLVGFFMLASVAPVRSAVLTATKVGCTDFLTALNLKPAHVQFMKCTLEKELQGKPLRAVYQVAGAHAAVAEARLVRGANLTRLKRSCCQWDSPPSQFTGKDGHVYTIAMVSSETNIKYRRLWPNIPSFEITVELLTEDI